MGTWARFFLLTVGFAIGQFISGFDATLMIGMTMGAFGMALAERLDK